MNDILKAMCFAFACYGAYKASLETYVAVRRDVGRTMYEASRQAMEGVNRFDIDILLPYPPEAQRNFRSN